MGCRPWSPQRESRHNRRLSTAAQAWVTRAPLLFRWALMEVEMTRLAVYQNPRGGRGRSCSPRGNRGWALQKVVCSKGPHPFPVAWAPSPRQEARSEGPWFGADVREESADAPSATVHFHSPRTTLREEKTEHSGPRNSAPDSGNMCVYDF